MRLVMYVPEHAEAGERLFGLVQELASASNSLQVNVATTLTDLVPRLRGPNTNRSLCLLLFTSAADLRDALCFGHVLGRWRLIVVLPNRQRSTIALAHRLRPRFLSYADKDLSDVGAVLQNMLRGANRRSAPSGEHPASFAHQ